MGKSRKASSSNTQSTSKESSSQEIENKILKDERFSSVKLSDHRFAMKTKKPFKESSSKKLSSLSNKLLGPSANGESEVKTDNSDDEESADASSSEEASDSDVEACISKDPMAYARGQKKVEYDSSDGEDSSEEEEDASDASENDDAQDDEVEETNRLAVCDLDWDRITCEDVYAIISSFIPAGGIIKKVSIYMSEFGRKRIEEEKAHGPAFLKNFGTTNDDSDLEEENEFESATTDEQNEALRKYQRELLKYYYAIVEFDSLETSVAVYNECQGVGIESTEIIMSLKYVPNEMGFDEEPTSSCTGLPANYEFVMDSNPDMTTGSSRLNWDETDPKRTRALAKLASLVKTKNEFSEELIKEYVGSDSDEAGEDSEDIAERQEKIKKIRNALAEEEKKGRKARLEDIIPLGSSDEERDQADEVEDSNEEVDDDVPEEIENETSSEEDDIKKPEEDLNPFHRKLQNREQQKRLKKEKRKRNKLLGDHDDRDSDNLFSDDEIPGEESTSGPLRKKQKKRTDSDEDPEMQSELDLVLMDEEDNLRQHVTFENMLSPSETTTQENRFPGLLGSSNDSVNPLYTKLDESYKLKQEQKIRSAKIQKKKRKHGRKKN